MFYSSYACLSGEMCKDFWLTCKFSKNGFVFPWANPFNLRHLLLSCDLLNIHKSYLNISLSKLVIHILKSFLQRYLFYTSSGNNFHMTFKLGLYLSSNGLNSSTAQRTWSVWDESRKNDKQILNAINFIFQLRSLIIFFWKIILFYYLVQIVTGQLLASW